MRHKTTKSLGITSVVFKLCIFLFNDCESFTHPYSYLCFWKVSDSRPTNVAINVFACIYT